MIDATQVLSDKILEIGEEITSEKSRRLGLMNAMKKHLDDAITTDASMVWVSDKLEKILKAETDILILASKQKTLIHVLNTLNGGAKW